MRDRAAWGDAVNITIDASTAYALEAFLWSVTFERSNPEKETASC